MAVRKSMEETLVVAGDRDDLLTRCAKGLIASGFKDVQTALGLGQVSGKLKKATTSGDILITATPHSSGQVQLVFKSTGNVDNIYALFSSPNKKIISLAKSSIA